MRAFITGAQGFVGPWLIDHLASNGDEVAMAATDFDVTDGAVVRDALRQAEPEVIYHLAAYSNVAASWSEPEAAVRTNTVGTSILLEAIRSVSPRSKVLLVSSAEVYGAVPSSELPITEDVPLTPVSPYAASKAAAEMLGIQAAVGFGLQVIRVRPFNHIGPGQTTDFVVSALARRIVHAKRDGERAIPVGNLSARRDFTDVRDVVKAYRLLAFSGQAGKVYNICSGQSVEIASIARQLIRLADADIVLRRDESLFRRVDVAEVRGDPSRVRGATGWQTEITLDQSLNDIVDYWRDSSEPDTTTALT